VTEVPSKGGSQIAKLPLAAALVALVGLADSIYLTIHHYTAEAVPCSLIEGCEMVLTSPYATLGGMIAAATGKVVFDPTSFAGNFPLAAMGAVSYFLVFLLALMSAFGNSVAKKLFGALVVLMAIFTGYLLYVQGALIGYFCQFCLLSAATTFTLLGILLASFFTAKKGA